jgi:putative transposase
VQSHKLRYNNYVKQIISAKLKLSPDVEQSLALRTLLQTYVKGLNIASHKAFELGKTGNGALIQKNVYEELRNDLKIPSQLACGICRYTGAAYKTLWKAAKTHANQCKENPKKRYKQYTGLDQPPKFSSLALTYQIGKDFGFKTDRQVSVLTLNGRISVPYAGWIKHVEYIQNSTTKIGAAKLCYDKVKRMFFLFVSLEIELPDFDPSQHTSVVGVDVGQRYLAVVTDTRDNTLFVSGKKACRKSEHYARKKKELQCKGTRSAKRRLRQLARRERRFKSALNHSSARQIVNKFPNAILGFEDLTQIRSKTNRRHSEKASKKQRKANHKQGRWSFRELQEYTAYKANLSGSMPIKVLSHYTSQACPKCGHTGKENRPNQGLIFRCVVCGFELHSDLVGARNIALRTLFIRQDWMNTGCLSISLNVSDAETKAECLKRYAELRWSPETKVVGILDIPPTSHTPRGCGN